MNGGNGGDWEVSGGRVCTNIQTLKYTPETSERRLREARGADSARAAAAAAAAAVLS